MTIRGNRRTRPQREKAQEEIDTPVATKPIGWGLMLAFLLVLIGSASTVFFEWHPLMSDTNNQGILAFTYLGLLIFAAVILVTLKFNIRQLANTRSGITILSPIIAVILLAIFAWVSPTSREFQSRDPMFSFSGTNYGKLSMVYWGAVASCFICVYFGLYQWRKLLKEDRTGRSVITAGLMTLCVMIGFAGAVTPKVLKDENELKRMIAEKDLGAISYVSYAYARDHDGDFPGNFDELLAFCKNDQKLYRGGMMMDFFNNGTYIPPKCSYLDKNRCGRFSVVSGLNETSQQEQIYVYETQSMGGYRLVLTVGGKVEKLKDSEFKTRLGKK